MDELHTNRSPTPESPMTNSFYRASSTIDDLTTALTNFSRVPSPEPATSIRCCCGKEECENLKAWMSVKSRLNMLTMDKEVGQALLQRHEAYVRQCERDLQDKALAYTTSQESDEALRGAQVTNESLNRELDQLLKEKTQLEKTLNQALVNNEVTEVSNKTILQELQEAKSTISRLSAHHARSLGWDTRLSAAMKERDDMQQERDRKLQTEVRRLQICLEEKRQSRLELSDSIIQDARSRLESIRSSHHGYTAKVEQDELTTVLEALVEDNESLKRDNAELQHLLTEAREDLNTLQQEVDEQRANPLPHRSPVISPYSRHGHSGSLASTSWKDYMLSPKGRSESKHRRRQGSQQLHSNPNVLEPLTPLTLGASRSPLSPASSLAPFDTRWPPSGQRSPQYPPSHVSFEMDDDADNPLCDFSEAEKPKKHRPLLLLTRSRGVQTETTPNLGHMTPSPLPSYISSISPQDPHSESSSFSESLGATTMSNILERAFSLLNRLTQADPLTLTHRLKRQHLQGADVGHLSRTTINNIINEALNLRIHYRTLLEDDKTVTLCTRKDLRNLFKLIKDLFSEMGSIRSTLNDIILDPTCASMISERALNPGKTDKSEGREGISQGTTGWIEGISKLFVSSARNDQGLSTLPSITRVDSLRGRERSRAPRFVPKLGPALAASATTVNVEFTGTGVGRAVTSTFTPGETISTTTSMPVVSSNSQSLSTGLMDIFAGAPKSDADPWVILPSGPWALHKSQSFVKPTVSSTATIGRNGGRRQNRLSRQVDAVIDIGHPQQIDEVSEPDLVPPLLERTLRRRGLSDTSIHSTFVAHAEDGATSSNLPPSPRTPVGAVGPMSRIPAWSERASVLSVLTSTVRNLHRTAIGMVPQGPVDTPSKASQKPEQVVPKDSAPILPEENHSSVANPRSEGSSDRTPPGSPSPQTIPILTPETPLRRAPISTSRTSASHRETGPKVSIPSLSSRTTSSHVDATTTVDPVAGWRGRSNLQFHQRPGCLPTSTCKSFRLERIIMELLLPLLLLSSSTLVAGYSWTFKENPRQCSNLTISISGNDGKPPYRVLIIPSGPTPLPNNVEARRILDMPFPGNEAEISFLLPYPENALFVAVVSDSTGFGTGGTSVAAQVTHSDNTTCFDSSKSVSPPFVFSIEPPNQIVQCQSMRIWWNKDNVQGTPNFLGVIPGGESFSIPTGEITDVPAQGRGFSWTPSIRGGTAILLVGGDSRGNGTGGSVPGTVSSGINNDGSCLSDSSPSSTPGSPAGGTYPTSIDGGTTGGGKGGSNVGAIVGGIIGGLALLIVAILLLWFFRRKQKKQRRAKERPDLLTTDDDDDEEGDERNRRGRGSGVPTEPRRNELPEYYQPEPFMVPDPTLSSDMTGEELESRRPLSGGTSSFYTRTGTPDGLGGQSVAGSGMGYGWNGQHGGSSAGVSNTRKGGMRPMRPVNIIQHDDAGPSESAPAEGDVETIELPPAYTAVGKAKDPGVPNSTQNETSTSQPPTSSTPNNTT
ncbi:hypothetical protein CVT24_012801 [Panaeolus cyanescens]|uniref:Uncharacterized protein n=1 Tax=Panaeolus cyanescens TaxID=181874 RepID=A0A409W2R5_9AGAR|nr:hypothetical protein CVT24_012801 [Panaeolus cyanescens]